MQKSNTKPIVLFGGTFSPIHFGHITPVLKAAQSVFPEKLIYLPCFLPPHKTAPGVSGEHRFNMVKLALESEQGNVDFEVDVSDYELEQQGHSYTLKTVQRFKQLYPQKKLYFVIGMDSLLDFHLWFEWQKIFEYCDLIVMKRPNYPLASLDKLAPELVESFMPKVHFVDTDELNISSTEIRSDLEQGRQSNFLPKSVFDYISINNLYI